MNAVMLSIRPQWCELIASGKKTVEVRKTRPKLETPFKCYIYCTKKPDDANNLLVAHGEDGKIRRCNGKVIGEFVCDYISEFVQRNGGFLVQEDVKITYSELEKSCFSHKEFRNYAKQKTVYGWHISDLKIYDKPKELGTFFVQRKGANDAGICWECDCYDGEECLVHHEKFIKRPPQSWGYVEELK